MSYVRVIPRDLFNEASLLKCYGKLYILTDGIESVELVHDGKPFDVVQDQADGSTYIRNVLLMAHGKPMHLSRPLNSRYEWPLYYTSPDDEVVEVFDGNGLLSLEFGSLLEKGDSN